MIDFLLIALIIMNIISGAIYLNQALESSWWVGRVGCLLACTINLLAVIFIVCILCESWGIKCLIMNW